MNRKKTLLTLMSIITIAGCAALQDFVEEPTIEFENIDITNLSLFQSTPVFTFKATNPNPVGVTVKKIAYDLKINDKKFVKGVTEKKIVLPASGSSTFDLPFTINHLDLFESLSEFGGADQVKYDLSGVAGFELFEIPYRKEGFIKIPKLPKISLKSVDVGKLSSKGASLTFAIDLENTNPFAVKLLELDYGIKLGGKEFATGTAHTIPLIGKKGKSTLTLPLNVSFSKLGMSVLNMLSQSSSGYELFGTMKFDIPKIGQKEFPFQKFGETPFVRN